MSQHEKPGRRPRLLEEIRATCRRLPYSYRAEQTYIHWIRRFIV